MNYKFIGVKLRGEPWSKELIGKLERDQRKIDICRRKGHPNAIDTGVRINYRKIMDCPDCSSRFYR